MKIEIHVLQNFAASNLNRDDTGTPKDCEFGGVRRARISSQCLKRAIRQAFEEHALISPDQRAARTKRLVEQVAKTVAEKKAVSFDLAERAVSAALGGAGLKADPDKEWKTQYLLFIPTAAIKKLAGIVVEHFEALATEAEQPVSSSEGEGAKKSAKAKARRAKADAKEAVPPEVGSAVKNVLADGARTPELALFGRMIADEPSWNIDAACQVAHAISTHRVSMEFDFYTAIDDLKPNDTAGSDMMGTVSFNSACFYRYLVVDADALTSNLGGDVAARQQAKDTVKALVRAAVLAIPTGKQNSMAAQNLPSLVLVDVRDGGEARSLANAFVRPVRPPATHVDDIVSQSIERLGEHLAALDKVYGAKGRKELGFFVVDSSGEIGKRFAERTGAIDRGSLDGLVQATADAAFGSES
mgnify:CR=1 FL=1